VLRWAEVIGDALDKFGLPLEATVPREGLNLDSIIKDDDRLLTGLASHHRFDKVGALCGVGKERFRSF
jgi:hypothetical protein